MGEGGPSVLTYELKKMPGLPLYEGLYRCIREDILSGKLKEGEKLPSKRSLAQHLEVSKITVETAYAQLLSEGYIRSQEKKGYFVEKVATRKAPAPRTETVEKEPLPADGTEGFPFSVWSRLQREVYLDYGEKLLRPLPNRGIPELRQAIADHLAAFRDMTVDPANILIGAGTDFLYNLLIQLLGRDLCYGVEDPGYSKIRRIYRAGGVRCVHIPMDGKGVIPQALEGVDVLHISPSHHYPTGLITAPSRRQELLRWAEEKQGWIIEDDYDSEFRFHSQPVSAMQTMDPERVIYMNSFSKSLAPSIRISYLILPEGLMAEFQRKLGFYSCTVPSFEQYTLARFLSRGHFEKHINRMRRFYRGRRNRLLQMVKNAPVSRRLTILEQDAGLHFLLRVDTRLPDSRLSAALEAQEIRFPPLGSFYRDKKDDLHMLVVNYTALPEGTMEKALKILEGLLEEENGETVDS